MQTNEVASYITTKIHKKNNPNYLVMLFQEFYNTQYAGSFLIEPDGRVKLDMIQGKHGDLSSGRKTPDLTATREPYTIQPLQFNYINREYCNIKQFHDMKSFALDAFRAIPSDGSSDTSSVQSLHKTPSYTEFFVAHERENSPLKVVFLDARLNLGYSAVNIETLLQRISDQSELRENQSYVYHNDQAA